MPKEDAIAKMLRIERTYPEDLLSHYVSNIVVQHDPDVFILSFFEVWPPAVLAESEEARRKAFNSLECVDAKCVARLVVTPNKMKEFLTIMQTNYRNYEELIQKLGKKE